ncbi:hypothetical protein C8A03DRAFT_39442 [Achaetomium macrosporum]|uniref:DUF7136 domain-containing protein n=1 Tax=Achaetomium macrosporum TaxID=79813 RepID=A0AAN7C0P3_9PEZI|nr:hypothetical protein C8A03DRAFT_39442 [Achaetomium macrosporum]
MQLSSRATWFLVAGMGPVVDAAGLPVVFAFQNPDLARLFNPSISYAIRNWGDVGRNDGVRLSHHLPSTNWSSHDPYFGYQYWDNFATEGRWWLTWSVAWQSCDEDSFYANLNEGLISNSSTWSVMFTTSESGEQVDLVTATSNNQTCPEEPGVAINVTNSTREVPAHVEWFGGDTCAVAASSIPNAHPGSVPGQD